MLVTVIVIRVVIPRDTASGTSAKIRPETTLTTARARARARAKAMAMAMTRTANMTRPLPSRRRHG